MHEGFRFCTHGLPVDQQRKIIRRKYYNFQSAVGTSDARSAVDHAAFVSGDFHPRHFTVRTALMLPARAARTPSPARSAARASLVHAVSSASARLPWRCSHPRA